ncbi:MAG: hypothetical protein WCT26_04075 [Candidatus Buchananbacteria bacterium]|jgi:hypothetical protein
MKIEVKKAIQEANIKSLALNTDFGNLRFEDAHPKLEKIKEWIIEFIDLKFEENLPIKKAREINDRIEQYAKHLDWLKKFSISTLDNPKLEHDNFETLIDNFYTSFFEDFVVRHLCYLKDNVFKKSTDVEKITKAEIIADTIIKNEEKYRKASETAENWIETEGKVISRAINDKTKVFSEKANNEHTKHRVWWWLVGSSSFLIGAIVMALILISKLSGNGENISVGASLLRISVMGMFIYGAFMAYQQFGVQRKLYESYKFKAIALSTMEELIKNYTDRKDRELIMNKAVDIIFSEPSLKEDKITHQRIIDDLLDILKSKV